MAFPNGEHLFGAFPGEDKTFWRVSRLPHGATFAGERSPWRPRLMRYLEEKMRARPPAAYQYPGR